MKTWIFAGLLIFPQQAWAGALAQECAKAGAGSAEGAKTQTGSGFDTMGMIFCNQQDNYDDSAAAEALEAQARDAASRANSLSGEAASAQDSSSSRSAKESASKLNELAGRLDRYGEEKEQEIEQGGQTLEQQAKDGIYGMTYGAKDAVITTKKKLKWGSSLGEGKDCFSGGRYVQGCYQWEETEQRESVPVSFTPIGQDMTLATKLGGAGIVLWNGTDAKVPPNSEILMKGCKPGQTCEQELKKGSAYHKTPDLPSGGGGGAAAEPSVKNVKAPGTGGGIRTPAPQTPSSADKKKKKKKNLMALIAGGLVLSFVTAEVVSHVGKKGDSTVAVLRGEAEVRCGEEKLILKPGQTLRADKNGNCSEPVSFNQKKLNRFWEKIK